MEKIAGLKLQKPDWVHQQQWQLPWLLLYFITLELLISPLLKINTKKRRILQILMWCTWFLKLLTVLHKGKLAVGLMSVLLFMVVTAMSGFHQKWFLLLRSLLLCVFMVLCVCVFHGWSWSAWTDNIMILICPELTLDKSCQSYM